MELCFKEGVCKTNLENCNVDAGKPGKVREFLNLKGATTMC